MSVVFGKLWEVQYSSKPMGSCPHLRAETSLAPVTPSTAWSASEASAFFSAWPRTMASSASKSTWPWPSMKKWGDLWGFYDFYGDVFQLNPRGQDLWCGLMWLRTIYHINLGYLWLIHSSKGCISWSRIPHGKIHGRIGHHSSIAHHQWLVVVELNPASDLAWCIHIVYICMYIDCSKKSRTKISTPAPKSKRLVEFLGLPKSKRSVEF